MAAVAATAAYGPALGIPLIEDDYPNINQALAYGSLDGAPALFRDAVFRLRATSYWAMFLLWQGFGLNAWGYHLASLILHIVNAWLVYAAVLAVGRNRLAAFWSGLFFAVHQGHQEAVMWLSAINELLLFFFGMASLLCFIRANRVAGRRWLWQGAGTILFVFAALSKESVVALVPLFLLAAARSAHWRDSLVRVLPYAAIVALACASVLEGRAYSFRFSDGSFSLQAPFWITWPRSFLRLMWVWGWMAAALIYLSHNRRIIGLAAGALAWMGIALVPYSFLTYSTQIPSRQTYLASAGLAFLFGLAASHALERWATRARAVCVVLVLILSTNVAYLWTRKRQQFVERAAPTTRLVEFARRTPGPIWVRCFPRPRLVAEEAVRLGAGRAPTDLVWSAGEAAAREKVAAFCYDAHSTGLP